jgi:uncharacterized protein (TIGR02147 family)
LDYRKFLADFYHFKKSLNQYFSHRLFSEKAGVKSSGYFSEVLSGRRHLSKAYAQAFAKAMGLGEKERTYFELMVAFDRAKNPAARQTIYESMLKALPVKAQRLRQSQLEYFSKWYNVAVRETLAITRIKGDGEELAEALDPPITPQQAKGSLKLLENLGLVARGKDGYWRANSASLLSPRDPGAGILLRAFQAQMLDRAREAMDRVAPEHCEMTSVTMSISAEGMAHVKRLAADFHQRVLEVVQADRKEDRVIQLNVQVFPLTKIAKVAQGHVDEKA